MLRRYAASATVNYWVWDQAAVEHILVADFRAARHRGHLAGVLLCGQVRAKQRRALIPGTA